jgi:hypothetical protein
MFDLTELKNSAAGFLRKIPQKKMEQKPNGERMAFLNVPVTKEVLKKYITCVVGILRLGQWKNREITGDEDEYVDLVMRAYECLAHEVVPLPQVEWETIWAGCALIKELYRYAKQLQQKRPREPLPREERLSDMFDRFVRCELAQKNSPEEVKNSQEEVKNSQEEVKNSQEEVKNSQEEEEVNAQSAWSGLVLLADVVSME